MMIAKIHILEQEKSFTIIIKKMNNDLQKWTMYLFINPRSIKELWETILLVSLSSI